MGKYCKHKFEVIKTIWPYEDGYGTVCQKCRMVVDTGLPKEVADSKAAVLNKRVKHGERF